MNGTSLTPLYHRIIYERKKKLVSFITLILSTHSQKTEQTQHIQKQISNGTTQNELPRHRTHHTCEQRHSGGGLAHTNHSRRGRLHGRNQKRKLPAAAAPRGPVSNPAREGSEAEPSSPAVHELSLQRSSAYELLCIAEDENHVVSDA